MSAAAGSRNGPEVGGGERLREGRHEHGPSGAAVSTSDTRSQGAAVEASSSPAPYPAGLALPVAEPQTNWQGQLHRKEDPMIVGLILLVVFLVSAGITYAITRDWMKSLGIGGAIAAVPIGAYFGGFFGALFAAFLGFSYGIGLPFLLVLAAYLGYVGLTVPAFGRFCDQFGSLGLVLFFPGWLVIMVAPWGLFARFQSHRESTAVHSKDDLTKDRFLD